MGAALTKSGTRVQLLDLVDGFIIGYYDSAVGPIPHRWGLDGRYDGRRGSLTDSVGLDLGEIRYSKFWKGGTNETTEV